MYHNILLNNNCVRLQERWSVKLHAYKLHLVQGQIYSLPSLLSPSPSHPPPINAIREASCVCSPPPPHTPHCWKLAISGDLGQTRGRPPSRGIKVLQLNLDSFCDHVQIFGAVIGHLEAKIDFWFFPRKWWKYRRPQIFGQSADILTSRAGTTARTVRERRRPYKLGGLSVQVKFKTTWTRGNITWTRALQPDLEEVRSWRFCWAQIVSRRGVWAPIFLMDA